MVIFVVRVQGYTTFLPKWPQSAGLPLQAGLQAGPILQARLLLSAQLTLLGENSSFYSSPLMDLMSFHVAVIIFQCTDDHDSYRGFYGWSR